MATSVNGFGTTFYGQCDFDTDGSFITTKWIILAFVPVVPTSSVRLRHAQEQGFFSMGTNYDVIMEMPLNVVQVLKTWAYVACFIALLGLLGKGADAPWKFILLGVMVLLPFILRALAKRAAHSTPQPVQQTRGGGATPAFRSRIEDLLPVSTCPKCNYTRKPDDYAPVWQCPSCKIAYNKYQK